MEKESMEERKRHTYVCIYIYIYADKSDYRTHFAKTEVKQRDASFGFLDRKTLPNVSLPP